MRVKCIKILKENPHIRADRIDLGPKTKDFTVGKEYIVLYVCYYGGHPLFYKMESDAGHMITREANQFELVSRHLPSNWEVGVQIYPGPLHDTRYTVRLSPKKWNRRPSDFYEEIEKIRKPLEHWRGKLDAPEVVQCYLREKDIIYREENEYTNTV